MNNDAFIDMIAGKIEESTLSDLSGIMSDTKRGREDAELRNQARAEERRKIADYVRSFKKTNSFRSRLKRIADGENHAWGPDLAAALAAGYATMCVSIEMSTHLHNCNPNFKIEITREGMDYLARSEGRRMTAARRH